jgi:hypothetical protein
MYSRTQWIEGCALIRACLNVFEKRKFFASAEIRTSHRLAHSLVAIPDTLSWLFRIWAKQRMNWIVVTCRRGERRNKDLPSSGLADITSRIPNSWLCHCLVFGGSLARLCPYAECLKCSYCLQVNVEWHFKPKCYTFLPLFNTDRVTQRSQQWREIKLERR